MSTLDQIRFTNDKVEVARLATRLMAHNGMTAPKGLGYLKKEGDRYLQLKHETTYDDSCIWLEKTANAYKFIYKVFSHETYTYTSEEVKLVNSKFKFIDETVELCLWCLNALDKYKVDLIEPMAKVEGNKFLLLTIKNKIDSSLIYLERTKDAYRFVYQAFSQLNDLIWKSAEFQILPPQKNEEA